MTRRAFPWATLAGLSLASLLSGGLGASGAHYGPKTARVRRGTFIATRSAVGKIVPSFQDPILYQGPATQIASDEVSVGQVVSVGQPVVSLANGTVLSSPVAGTVISVAGSGSAVGLLPSGLSTKPSSVTGTGTVAVVAGIIPTTVRLMVPAINAAAWKPGQSVRIQIGPRQVHGIVAARNLLPHQGLYPVTVTVPSDAPGFRLGMTAEATIVTRRIPHTLLVPMAGLWPDQGAYAVKTSAGRTIKVQILAVSPLQAAIRGSLAPNTRVVLPSVLGPSGLNGANNTGF